MLTVKVAQPGGQQDQGPPPNENKGKGSGDTLYIFLSPSENFRESLNRKMEDKLVPDTKSDIVTLLTGPKMELYALGP